MEDFGTVWTTQDGDGDGWMEEGWGVGGELNDFTTIASIDGAASASNCNQN